MSKVCLGYYDKDGKYIGQTMEPTNDKYVLVMGIKRKKIAEYDHQSPYKHHAVNGWTKTFNDQNRIYMHAEIYIEGKLNQTITSMPYWYSWRHEEKDPIRILMETVFEHIKSRQDQICHENGIGDVQKLYYPIDLQR